MARCFWWWLWTMGDSGPRSFPTQQQVIDDCCAGWASRAAQVRLCIESTGLYGLDAALVLQQQPGVGSWWPSTFGASLSLSMVQRSGTDPIDARLLAAYAQRMPVQSWQPPSRAGRRLSLLRVYAPPSRDQLHAEQLHAAAPPSPRPRSCSANWNAVSPVTALHPASYPPSSPADRLRSAAPATVSSAVKFPGIAETAHLQLLADWYCSLRLQCS